MINGKVKDIAVDLRPKSPTFGKHVSVILSREKLQLFISRGFGHGFSALSNEVILAYNCDNYYSAPHDGGVRYDDSTLGVDWKIEEKSRIISGKDKILPLLRGI